jgi:hypothetical protein
MSGCSVGKERRKYIIFNIQSTKQILINSRYKIALKRFEKGVIKNKINHVYNSNSSLLSVFSVWLTKQKQRRI